MTDRVTIRPHLIFGALAWGFYGFNCGYNVLTGHPENVLWICHVGTLLVGTGLVAGIPTIYAVGLLWLLAGTPLWLFDILMGAQMPPTSIVSHLGGLAVGMLALKCVSIPRGVWWKAFIAAAALRQACRWITPPGSNVNLAFGVWAGWEGVFPSYFHYMLLVSVSGAALLLALERGLSWILSSRTAPNRRQMEQLPESGNAYRLPGTEGPG